MAQRHGGAAIAEGNFLRLLRRAKRWSWAGSAALPALESGFHLYRDVILGALDLGFAAGAGAPMN